MDKKHDAIESNGNSELASSCLDMIWDNNITDDQLKIVLETVKSPKILQKLSEYQYNQDIIKSQVSTNYINIVESVNQKLTKIQHKEQLQEKRKFVRYQQLMTDRSFFWPFSLPSLTICAIFFIVLSINNPSQNQGYQNLAIKNNNTNQYLFNASPLKDMRYNSLSTLEEVSINFNSDKLYSIEVNNQTK
jgi:hypothetical protein